MKRNRAHHAQTRVSTVWIIPEIAPPPKPKPQSKPANIGGATHHVVTAAAAPILTLPAQPAEAAHNDSPTPEGHLDLDALRTQAVQQEIGRKKSPIEIANDANLKNHSLEVAVADATDKAQRPDCRTAHTGAGLFAPLVIAADLIRDKGCKF